MNINFYDLYYTVNEHTIEKEITNGQGVENDYITFNDIIPNHYIGIKPRETLVR